VADTNGVGGFESCQLVGELAERAAKTVVGSVVGRLADCIATEDGSVAVVVVGGVGCEVDFAEETLLVMAELANHVGQAWLVGGMNLEWIRK